MSQALSRHGLKLLIISILVVCPAWRSFTGNAHPASVNADELSNLETVSAPQVWVEPVTKIEFVLIPAGSFMMGSPPNEMGREPQETQHRVRLSRAFYLGRYEVTQGEWEKVMGGNPSHFKDCGPRCPVERVNFHQVQAFITKLKQLSGGEKFRLPTEAEWEYACRAGTVTPFSTGENLTTDQANYCGDYPHASFPVGVYREKTMPVGSLAPNAWGLYDMHGNVWEWCADWHCPYPKSPAVDPVGKCTSDKRVIRGGSWAFNADSARSAARYTHRPQDLGYSLGFRLVRDLP